MALSVSEFATKFKTKYPQYNEMPDDSLALLIIKEAPQYKKAVDLGTLQAKYFKTAKDFGILSDDDISGFSAPSKVAPVQPVKPSLSTVSGGEFSFLPGVMALANEQPSIPGITAFPSNPTIPAIQALPNASSMVSKSATGMSSVAPGTVGNVTEQMVESNKLTRGPAPEMSSDEVFRQGNQFQLRLAAAQKKWDDDYKLGKIPMKTIEVPGDMGRPASMSVPSIPRPTENSLVFEEAGVPLKPGSFQNFAGELGTYLENVLGPATGLLLNRKAGERRAITFNEKKIAAEGIKAERELAKKEASGIELTPEEKQLKETLNPGVWDSMVQMAKQVYDDPKRFLELGASSMAVGVLMAPAMDAGIGFVASRVRDAARVYKLSRVSKILKARRAERLGEAMAGGPVVETKTAIDDVVSRYANQVGLQNARRAVADALIAGNDSRILANALQKVGIRSTKGQRRLIANIGSEMAEEVGPVAFAQTVTDWGQGRGDLDAESIVTNVFSSLPIAAVGGGVMGGASSVFRNNAGMEAPVADRVSGRFMLSRGSAANPDYARGVSETVSSPEFQSTAGRLARTENSPEVSRHFERLVPEIGAGINDSRIAGAGEDAFVRGRMQNRGAFTIGETAYGGGEAAGVHEAIHGVERFIKANPDTHGDVEIAIQDWKDQAYSDLRDNNPELFKSLQSMTRTEREAKEELFAQTMTRALGHEDNDWGLTMEPALLQRFSQYIGQDVPESKSAPVGAGYVASADDLSDVPFSIKKNNQERLNLANENQKSIKRFDKKFMQNDMSGLSDRVTRAVVDASDEYRLNNIHKVVPKEYVPKQAKDKTVTIYRGIPSNVDDGIRVGDWVSLDKDYAMQHGTGGKEGTNKVVSITVPTSDVVWAGTDMNEFFYAPEGIRKDGESPVDVLNRLGEDYFSKSKKEEKPRLRVTHNLDESKLEKVDKLGGFAKPSLAVMRADQPATSDFGDITLVGKKELGNPKNDPVFDRDVYSPRVPARSFRPTKKLDDFFARVYRNQIDTIGDSGYDSFLERLEKGDKDSAISYLKGSDAAQAYYLKETNQMPSEIIRKDVSEDIFKNNKKLQDAAIKLYESNAPDSYVALKKLLYNALAKQYESLSKKGSKSMRESFSEMASDLREKAGSKEPYDVIYSYNPNEMVRTLKSELAGDIDEKKTKDRNRKIVEKDRQAYLDWWKNKLDEILPESSALIEGTRKQFNLDNVVDAMKGIKAKEKSMTYSTGHAKAAAAKQFSDIEQMRNAAIDRMAPKNEDGEKDNLLFDYVSRLANYTKYSSHFSAMDYASEAIGKLAAGAITESRARSILSADHDVTYASIETIMDAANSIKKVMTDMFEAKPQRAVGFDEFSGAVIPENVSQKTLDILNKRGISKIEKYKPGDIESRTEALNKFTEDQFSVVKAGIPESKKNDPKVVAEAKRQWDENGTDSPFFKRWFGDSKVVDEDGKPLVVYHGTNADFTEFDKKKIGSNYGESMGVSNNPEEGGFFFTTRKSSAKNYAGEERSGARVVEAYLSLKNPSIETAGDYWDAGFKTDRANFKALRDRGFDGLIVKSPDGSVFVVFSPSQIKSATGNRGTFDPENSDIRYSIYPRNDKQKALALDAGISKIEKYRPGDIESRTEALNKFTEDQFSVVKAGIPESKKNDPKVVAEAKRQWDENGTDSPFFKRWFGDSKVVDEDGKPLVVYHGFDGENPFTEFKQMESGRSGFMGSERKVKSPVFFFSESHSVADAFARNRAKHPGYSKVHKVFLSVKNPIDLSDPKSVPILKRAGVEAVPGVRNRWELLDDPDVIEALKNFGYDGARVNELASVNEFKKEYGSRPFRDPKSKNTWVVFAPTQIKSATSNLGTFDEENADIRFSLYPRNEKQKAQRSIIKAAYDGLRKNGLALPNKISLHDISQKWGAMPSGLDDEARNAYRKKWDSALESLREFIIEDEALALEAGITKADLDNENIQEIVCKLSDWANAMSEKPKKSMEGFTAEDERMLRGASPEVIAEYEREKSDAIAGKSKKKISNDEQRRVARYTPPEGMAVDEWNTANDIGIPHGDPTASYKDVFGGQVASGETPETKTDIIVRQVYDYLDPLKKIQVRLTGKESGGAMHEAMLQASRAQDKANKVKHSFLDPVKKIMQKSGLTLEDVDRFLYARHAIERNEKVALINEDFRDPENHGGSGMSNKTARAIMRHYEIDEPEKFKALQRIGIINDRMNKWRIDYARSAGILTAEEEAAYEKSYKHYVPLRGRADDVTGEIKSSSGMKKGMQAHKSEKRALGRRSMAESVTAQNFTRTLEIVSNAEKNKVGLAVAKMVRDNPDPEFWTIDKTPMKYVYDKKTGEAKRAPDMKMNAPNEFTFYENGERHTIRFNTKEGLRIATALNGMSDVTGNTVLKAVSKMNRMLAGMITSYSPEFVLSNAPRDAITASITSSVRDGAKVAAKTISGAPMAAAAIVGREFGKNMGEWGKFYQRFTKAGGKTAFLTLESFEDFAKNIESDLMDGQRSSANPKKVFKNLIHAIERVNAGVENGTRLAYFRNLVESGMSDEDAALKAKELTVNFERHGQQKWMNQLWMFMNAALQSAANVARLFTNEKTRKAAIGAASTLVAVGASNALMNKELGGSDDESGEDYWDRIQPWEKDRNIVFLNPLKKDGSGVRIPLPYEFSFFIRLGQELVDMGYGKHPLDVALSTVNSAISAVSPLGSPIDIEGGGIKNPIGLAIPTPLQPFADISKNRDYSGRQIHPEDMPFGPKRPDSQKYYPGVNPIIRESTAWLNSIGGGNEHVSSKYKILDISPESIEHIINAYTGGIGALLQRGSGAIKSATSPDETVQVRQIPFVRKFFRGDMGNDRADFKKIADKAGQVDAHYVSLLENGKNSEADKYENENYLLISTARIFKDAGKGIDFTSKDQRDELNSLYKRSKRQFKRAEEIDLKLKESTDSEKQNVYRKQIDSLLSSAWDGFMDGVK